MQITTALIAAGVLIAIQPSHDSPTLVNTCVITEHVATLVDFYLRVLGRPALRTGNVYAEFHTGAAVLAIFSATAQEAYLPGSAQPAHNASTILEFRVADVDQEFARLQPIVRVWVKKPTTTPWHTRSFYFRDPDGNRVDFYALAR